MKDHTVVIRGLFIKDKVSRHQRDVGGRGGRRPARRARPK